MQQWQKLKTPGGHALLARNGDIGPITDLWLARPLPRCSHRRLQTAGTPVYLGIGADAALPPGREIEPTTAPPEIPVHEPRSPVPPRTEPPRPATPQPQTVPEPVSPVAPRPVPAQPVLPVASCAPA